MKSSKDIEKLQPDTLSYGEIDDLKNTIGLKTKTERKTLRDQSSSAENALIVRPKQDFIHIETIKSLKKECCTARLCNEESVANERRFRQLFASSDSKYHDKCEFRLCKLIPKLRVSFCCSVLVKRY